MSHHIEAYAEYKRIVGDDDRGQLFSEQQFEEYKKKVAKFRTENRLYVYWVNREGLECKAIGPETKCYCGHRYKNHKTDVRGVDLPENHDKTYKCPCKNCNCKKFEYVPTLAYSTNLARCRCKHVVEDHLADRRCSKPSCKCLDFSPSWTCRHRRETTDQGWGHNPREFS